MGITKTLKVLCKIIAVAEYDGPKTDLYNTFAPVIGFEDSFQK